MTTDRPVLTLTLTEEELSAVGALLDTVRWPEDAGRVELLSRRLPERVQEFLLDFRLAEPAGACVLRGYPLDGERVGPTPLRWKDAEAAGTARREEAYLALLGAVLGDLFSFRTLQDGRLVQDLLPTPGQEETKSGNSSASTLDLHTEDAFHPYRCDYLGLLCLRNPDRVPTAFAELRADGLAEPHRRVLGEPRFLVRPDETHLVGLAGDTPSWLVDEPVPLLFGGRDTPYLRFDDYFAEPLPGDAEAVAAVAALSEALAGAERDALLGPGDVLFVDNYRAVHGRRPFQARYDGTDRWLKRISVSRDLRRSRDARPAVGSRMVG
jgi:Fe(II)/alpha-ketoglutarate-dependent arginine beta-hydroxylase